jgi:acetyl esterase
MGLNAELFDPSAYPADVVEYNRLANAASAQVPWPMSAQQFRDLLPAMLAAASPDGKLYASPRARELAIPVGGGVEIRGRVIPAEAPVGVYVHLHGGGWTIGAHDQQDLLLERLADETDQTVVSVDYRMAPEHPFPTPLDDAEAATRWLIEHAGEEFGVERMTLGGESAGATLSLAVAVRLREGPAARPLEALNLLYGAYDLTLTPSAAAWGSRGGLLGTEMLTWFYEQYVADPAQRRDPEVSPLFAALHELPPTLVTVGSEDLLRDDSLFLYTRLLAAGVEVELQVQPGAQHGFEGSPTSAAAAANARIYDFLARTSVPS